VSLHAYASLMLTEGGFFLSEKRLIPKHSYKIIKMGGESSSGQLHKAQLAKKVQKNLLTFNEP